MGASRRCGYPAEIATLQRRLELLREEREQLIAGTSAAGELASQLVDAEKEQAIYAKSASWLGLPHRRRRAEIEGAHSFPSRTGTVSATTCCQ
jgi:hypothetical protein